MRELKWNKFEFVECLGAVPVYDEFFDSFTFSNVLDDLTVALTVWPWESTIAISIANDTDAEPFLSLNFVVRDQITFIKEKEFMSLQFRDSVLVSTRFWQNEKDEIEEYLNLEATMKADFELSTFPRLAFRVL